MTCPKCKRRKSKTYFSICYDAIVSEGENIISLIFQFNGKCSGWDWMKKIITNIPKFQKSVKFVSQQCSGNPNITSQRQLWFPFVSYVSEHTQNLFDKRFCTRIFIFSITICIFHVSKLNTVFTA